MAYFFTVEQEDINQLKAELARYNIQEEESEGSTNIGGRQVVRLSLTENDWHLMREATSEEVIKFPLYDGDIENIADEAGFVKEDGKLLGLDHFAFTLMREFDKNESTLTDRYEELKSIAERLPKDVHTSLKTPKEVWAKLKRNKDLVGLVDDIDSLKQKIKEVRKEKRGSNTLTVDEFADAYTELPSTKDYSASGESLLVRTGSQADAEKVFDFLKTKNYVWGNLRDDPGYNDNYLRNRAIPLNVVDVESVHDEQVVLAIDRNHGVVSYFSKHQTDNYQEMFEKAIIISDNPDGFTHLGTLNVQQAYEYTAEYELDF